MGLPNFFWAMPERTAVFFSLRRTSLSPGITSYKAALVLWLLFSAFNVKYTTYNHDSIFWKAEFYTRVRTHAGWENQILHEIVFLSQYFRRREGHHRTLQRYPLFDNFFFFIVPAPKKLNIELSICRSLSRVFDFYLMIVMFKLWEDRVKMIFNRNLNHGNKRN